LKKIVIVFYGPHNPAHVLHFAIVAAQQNSYHINGVFINDDEERSVSYPFPNDLPLTEEQVTTETIKEENLQIIADNIQFFQDECTIANVAFSVEKNVGIRSLIENTSGADLIAIDARHISEATRLTQILPSPACPVSLITPTAAVIENVIFAFDGSENSIYAIKKFVGLFPHLKSAKSYLVSVDKETEIIKNKEFINGWLADHYPKLNIDQLGGNDKEDFINYLRQFPDNTMVVMGAYGRSGLSRLFHSSFADKVLSDTRTSLFSAHK
jgi:hypothetical protein